MKKKCLFTSLLMIMPLFLSSCENGPVDDLEIELDEYTPVAYVGEEYDFTDVLYVEEDVTYKLEVYYQNYNTKEEFTLPVIDDFYFTPIELFDLTVVVNASKDNHYGKRIRQISVTYNAEEASRNSLEMCNFESGDWRGTGSAAEFSYVDTYGDNSKTARKVTFKNSWDLPDDFDESDKDNPATVNASFNLATTAGLGVDAGIDSKVCVLSFDIKLSNEFYESSNSSTHLFLLKIEDDAWIPHSVILPLVENRSDFTSDKTDNGWIHVEHNLSEVGELDGLGNGTYVITFGFYGITNITRSKAYVIFDNISLQEIPEEQRGNREKPTRYNLEMCRFEPGAWRGTGSKAEISYTELRGENSTSSRKITFVNSENLEEEENATVNASFNLANTWSIGTNNLIDIKKCTLSFDIKLSEEFFNTGHPYQHMFSFKVEDEEWKTYFTWLSFVDNVSDYAYEKTDNGWMHVSINLALATELMEAGNSTYVITFGFFGINNTTRLTASVIFDNIALTNNE